MKCYGPGGKCEQLQQGKVLIVNNHVAACASTYNPETCRVLYLHHIQCHCQKDKFVHLQQGYVQIIENPVAACTSTVQP